jgi:uncharacterized protein (TIGR02270 family)
MTRSNARPPVLVVVQQHAEESAALRDVRSVLVRAPHVRLPELRRHDDRIAAHLDGLAVAGSDGIALCTAALERPGAGEVFALAVLAIAERDRSAMDRLMALSASLPDAKRGLLSAFGWMSAPQLQGVVQAMLTAAEPARREVAIVACRLHGADPGAALTSALRDADAPVRADAFRTAGELGRADALPLALAALADADADVAARAAVAACQLGDRGEALAALEAGAARGSPRSDESLAWLLLAADFERGRRIMRRMAQAGTPDEALKRRVIRACGLLGDTGFVPWLIELMSDDTFARAAGESFSLITGADLAALGLERPPAQGAATGADEDADGDNVAMDHDDGLPWPDRDRVLGWWRANAGRMPVDARCFMGAAPAPGHCALVLREGFQRQRIVASRLLCLQAPGSRLFPVCAPAWRQRRKLPSE